MSQLKSFTLSAARPLPVILLADVSGSMGADGKINALNNALRDMVAAFKTGEDLRAEVHLSVISFGGVGARHHIPLTPAAQVTWHDAPASGGTPMGGAFELARQMIADREVISGRAYTPTIVLMSDGQPNDEWRAPLTALLADERAKKAMRLALAIGDDADEAVLKQFLDNPEARVLRASDASQIHTFIRLVTMSVQARSRSATPNAAPKIEWDL
ncbi:MAG: VWA domain-containing protein [Deltaproteobacteria bacterium]|nr:VWA domain-containing protein [Deltaproteobacteria bacterium]